MAKWTDVTTLIEEIQTSLKIKSYSDHDKGFDDGLNYVLDLIETAPTLAQPNEPLTPCDICRFSPPSSGDGKPCCMCPADRRKPEGEEDA